MPEIPLQAVQAAAEALEVEDGNRTHFTFPAMAKVALEAAAPLLAEHIAAEIERIVVYSNLPRPRYERGGFLNDVNWATRIAREAFTAGERSGEDAAQTAPDRTETAEDGSPRFLGSPDDPMAPEGRTALRDRIEGAIRSVLEREAPTWKRLAWPASHAVLAVRDDVLTNALHRADLAEAAVARVRRLCDLTIAASCRVQAIDQAQDTLAVLEMTDKDVELCGDRCPQVFGQREVVCTLPKGHAAHRSGGTAWEALCDEVAQQAERDAAALARVRALAEEWATYAPAGQGGLITPDVATADAGRALLAALDVPADGEQERS